MNKFALLFSLFLLSCSRDASGIKVAATALPHAEMLEFIKPDLEKEGIPLTILIIDDYNTPNRALADREVDANFFQHKPFLDEQVHSFGYPIESLTAVHLEPMGIYSTKIKKLSDLKENGTIAIPNDPTNEGRALLLLQKEGLISLDKKSALEATPLDIINNPKKIRFIEVDAAMLPRTIDDVDAAVINTNFALSADLTSPIAKEGVDSPYVNVVAIHKASAERPELIALKEALTSEKMRAFIQEHYNGALLPAF